MPFLPILRAEELWSGELYATSREGVSLFLFRDGERVCAFEDRCAHQGVRVSAGTICAGRIVCPAHLWEYDLATGRGVRPYGFALRPFRTKIADGWISVEIARTASEGGEP